MRLSLHCKDLPALLSRRLDVAASPGDALRVRLHLSTCPSCSAVDAQMVFMRRALRQLAQTRGPTAAPGVEAPGGDSAEDPQ